MMCGINVLISMVSPFLAYLGNLRRGVSAIGFLPKLFVDQPPQPPMVTFTSFWPVKNWPLLVLATTTMFCVAASRMRVATCALPDIGVRWEVATPGLGLPSDTTMISLT